MMTMSEMSNLTVCFIKDGVPFTSTEAHETDETETEVK